MPQHYRVIRHLSELRFVGLEDDRIIITYVNILKSFNSAHLSSVIKQIPFPFVISAWQSQQTQKDKLSPADSPTKRPADTGGKSKLRKSDKTYRANKPHGGNIAKKREEEEQPVHSADKN